jgi:hypothetical protein
MTLSLEDGPLKEAAIFTRAVENVFRKLIRLLLGRMTLTRLQEMIRVIYIEEAEDKLGRERPGKSVPLTELGLMTGLDTRTLNRYRRKSSKRNLHNEYKFLREITPESSILDYWSTRAEYFDHRENKPLIIPVRGNTPSLESLLRDANVSRGVTIGSVLERLENSKSIRVHRETQTVELRSRIFQPFPEKGMTEAMEVGFFTIGKLIDTLLHNLDKGKRAGFAFFQRSNWTTRLSREVHDQFRHTIRKYLSNSEEIGVKLIANFEDEEIDQNQITAGISMFYFEDEP